MLASVKVAMKHGGFMHLNVDGRCQEDSEVEIYSVKWPGGGEVAEKNIADMEQLKESFIDTLERNSKDNF